MIETRCIVLKSSPFDESGKILTLFSFDCGIISAIIKSIPESRYDLIQTATPLYEGIFILKKGRSELFKVQESSSLTYRHIIKQDFKLLSYAVEMIQIIEKTQDKFKPLPLLFQLLSVFLSELEKTKFPELVIATFYLKFLRHEGLFDLEYFCSETNLELPFIERICSLMNFEEMKNIDLSLLDFKVTKDRFYHLLHL